MFSLTSTRLERFLTNTTGNIFFAKARNHYRKRLFENQVFASSSYTLIPEDQPVQLAAHIRAFIASELNTAT